MSKKWSQDEINLAMTMIREFETYKTISDKLDRTEKSVRVKLQRMGYKRFDYSRKIFICLCCNIEFIDYVGRVRKYCSRSCSTKISNTLNPKRKRKGEISCLWCNESLVGTSAKKYCSQTCQHIFKADTAIRLNKASSIVCKRWLIYHDPSCSICHRFSWNQRRIPLELDHVDGNYKNNLLENLRLLCPNCHAQTNTYKGKNRGNGRHFRRLRYSEGKSY